MRLSAGVTAFLSATLAVATAQAQVQVYLHPQPTLPSHHLSAPTLSASQAKAVLAHHLGESADDFEEIPQDESMWRHLLGVWSGQKEERTKARVVIIEGGVSAQDVLPTSITSPAFYLEEGSSTRALLASYLRHASHLLEQLKTYLPSVPNRFKDTFDMAGTKIAAMLSEELSALTALADSIPWLDGVKSSSTWRAISISSLANVDRDTEVYQVGKAGVRAGLESMTQPDSPPLLLIIAPSHPRLSARSRPGISRRANETLGGMQLANACYSSESVCSNATSCFGHGSCRLKSSTSDAECWGCVCTAGFAGVECQKQDYTVPFVIIVFSTVLLLGLVLGSISLLMTVGDTKLPSTLNLAVSSGHAKRD